MSYGIFRVESYTPLATSELHILKVAFLAITRLLFAGFEYVGARGLPVVGASDLLREYLLQYAF